MATYINNVTLNGNASVTNGVLSGFSNTSSYALVNKTFPSTNNPWEFVIPFKVTSLSSEQYIECSNDYGMGFGVTTSGKLIWFISNNGTSWNVTSGQTSSSTISVNTKYYAKMGWTGSLYYLDISTDNETYTRFLSTTNSTPLRNTQFKFGISRGNSSPLINGEIYLNECYINANGERWWNGVTDVTGKTYNITEVGKVANTNGILSGFSTSDYALISKSLPTSAFNSDWEFVVPFKTNRIAQQVIMCADGFTGGFGLRADGKLEWWLSSDGTSWNLANGVASSLTLSANTQYYIRFKFVYTGDYSGMHRYVLEVSTDKENWTQYITIPNTTAVFRYNATFKFGISRSNVNPSLYGQIDLNESYILINGQKFWEGVTVDALPSYCCLGEDLISKCYVGSTQVDKIYLGENLIFGGGGVENNPTEPTEPSTPTESTEPTSPTGATETPTVEPSPTPTPTVEPNIQVLNNGKSLKIKAGTEIPVIIREDTYNEATGETVYLDPVLSNETYTIPNDITINDVGDYETVLVEPGDLEAEVYTPDLNLNYSYPNFLEYKSDANLPSYTNSGDSYFGLSTTISGNTGNISTDFSCPSDGESYPLGYKFLALSNTANLLGEGEKYHFGFYVNSGVTSSDTSSASTFVMYDNSDSRRRNTRSYCKAWTDVFDSVEITLQNDSGDSATFDIFKKSYIYLLAGDIDNIRGYITFHYKEGMEDYNYIGWYAGTNGSTGTRYSLLSDFSLRKYKSYYNQPGNLCLYKEILRSTYIGDGFTDTIEFGNINLQAEYPGMTTSEKTSTIVAAITMNEQNVITNLTLNSQ